MKNVIITTVSLILILLLTGCRTMGEASSSPSFYYEEYEIIADTADKVNPVTENKESVTDPETESEIPSEENLTTESNEEKTATEIEENTADVPDKTKTLTVNGKVYTAYFKETTEKGKYDDFNRKTNIYYTEDGNVSLEYDYVTDSLLRARIDNLEEPEGRITENEAKKIAEDFIKTQCDISPYTFHSVTAEEDEGYYYVIFSKYIAGYCSEQAIKLAVTFDGEIESYYHNKFIFDGMDTDVKINLKKLDKKLNKKMKEVFGKDVEYTATAEMLDVTKEGDMAMYYATKVLQVDEETGEQYYEYVQCYVALEGNNINMYSSEKM